MISRVHSDSLETSAIRLLDSGCYSYIQNVCIPTNVFTMNSRDQTTSRPISNYFSNHISHIRCTYMYINKVRSNAIQLHTGTRNHTLANSPPITGLAVKPFLRPVDVSYLMTGDMYNYGHMQSSHISRVNHVSLTSTVSGHTLLFPWM